MYSVSFAVSFGLLFAANLLKDLRALPIPTTPLPPLRGPLRDGYSVDYLDAYKSSIAQAHENAKKYPRTWGPPPANNPFKDQDLPRGLIETNNIQQDYAEVLKKEHFITYEDDFYLDEDFADDDEETNYIDPPYLGEPGIELGRYPSGYPIYGDLMNNDYDVDVDLIDDVDAERDFKKEDADNDKGIDLLPTTTPQPVTLTLIPSSTKAPKPPSTPPLQPMPMPTTSKPMSPIIVMSSLDSGKVDYDQKQKDKNLKSSEGKSRELRGTKPPRNYSPPSSTPSLQMQIPSPTPEPKVKLTKEVKPILIEEPVPVKVPVEREVFSRTTTITKTTTWYINSDNELIVKEEIDGKPRPLKGKYVKTHKTTTSGPVPWYLQGFEDVIFEEENEKSKTILDKMTYLKGMNPTSITSYTTAPNPWSTEVHEEVVFEESINKKEIINEADSKPHYLGPHSSPLEHMVEYLPRYKFREDVDEKFKKDLEEEKEHEDFIIEEENEEEYYDVNEEEIEEYFEEDEDPEIVDVPLEFPHHPIPLQAPVQYPPYNQQFPPTHPTQHPLASHEVETFEEEFAPINYQENLYPNQLTTTKPMGMENNFTPFPTVQPTFNHAPSMSGPYAQPYANHPSNWEHQGPTNAPPAQSHPGGGLDNRRDKGGGRRGEPSYQSPPIGRPLIEQQFEPQVEETGRQKGDPGGKQRLSPQEAKRQMYQNRQFPNRQTRARDL